LEIDGREETADYYLNLLVEIKGKMPFGFMLIRLMNSLKILTALNAQIK
jgi:hypothetical protein